MVESRFKDCDDGVELDPCICGEYPEVVEEVATRQVYLRCSGCGLESGKGSGDPIGAKKKRWNRLMLGWAIESRIRNDTKRGENQVVDFRIVINAVMSAGGPDSYMDVSVGVDPERKGTDVVKALVLVLREEVKRVRPGVTALEMVRTVTDMFRVVCKNEEDSALCDGGCGGMAVIEVMNRKYCTGCLAGAYILNKHALNGLKDRVRDSRGE